MEKLIVNKNQINDYVVIDIENPNRNADSICQIGIIQIKNNEVVYKNNLLINPEASFDNINIRVHGITPNMVKDAITFDTYWKEIENIFKSNIIVGHGVKFDISVISKCLKKYGISLPKLNIICTQHLAQKYLDVDKYKLDYICDYLNIKLDSHHDAFNDAEASYKIFEYIKNNYDITQNDIEEYLYENNLKKHHREFKTSYTDDTKSLQNLKQIIEKIMSDNKIETKEISNLKLWLSDNNRLEGNYPFDKINQIVTRVLLDGNITPEEYNDLSLIFSEFIDPLSVSKKNDDILFDNQVFCLTGTFNTGLKEEIENKIIQKGGLCSKGVTSKINYLIVGGSGSDAWKFGNYGGKVQKAMELNEKGKNIKIIGEEEFICQL